MGYYDYTELLEQASAPNASQEAVDSLGRWFEDYGQLYWNGECYYADDGKKLWPVYKKVDEDDYESVGYTWDHAESELSLSK